MRGKRSKQYRKLMQQYGLTFGFREPYQVLIDAEMIQDADRFQMNLVGGLERTLHGKIKPMITQCSIRHLYTTVPQSTSQIDLAKTFERRRCNHHTLEQPLSTLECLSSVLDPKSSYTNRHRYVVASQDDDVRRHMRLIPGVPLVYVKRSVMVMEPMADSSEGVREGVERGKFRSGLRSKRGSTATSKRKRDDDGGNASMDGLLEGNSVTVTNGAVSGEGDTGRLVKRKRTRGPKGPNPLSIKKSKTRKSTEDPAQAVKEAKTGDMTNVEVHTQLADAVVDIVVTSTNGAREAPSKRKRKRKHKSADGERASAAPILALAAQDPLVS